MDLLIVQLKASIRRLLDTKGVRGRVLDKVNRYGEVVIGVILERPPAPPVASFPPSNAAVEPSAPPKRDDAPHPLQLEGRTDDEDVAP